MKKRTRYEKEIRIAMIEEDVSIKELNDYIGYNSPSNLATAIKNRTLGMKYHINLCEKLDLDYKEILNWKFIKD